MDKVKNILDKPEFPLSNAYDPDWVMDNQMGPNAMWLIEWLAGGLTLEPGMRVLDLGCGRGLSSIFLAKEYGVKVWAADLWIGPDNNWRRVREAGVEDLVCPIQAEAHKLPFAKGFFDAIVSIDAYTYFGTDALYLDYLCNFVRPAGQIGAVMPGLTQTIEGAPPAHLTAPQSHGKPFWQDECWCFRSRDWWQQHWSHTSKVEGVSAELLPDGWRHWRDFEQALELSGKNIFPPEVEALDKDQGRYIGLVKVTARRTDAEAENFYDESIGVRYGVDT